eukprot:TRINITY_DN1110_c0_g1_i8.p1 TRINITY_DN1110_c0_g1~~TRINITY_DN1110_c0_g1_i8.p1  ORF type:complete len:122 (-),score=14.44 TRINITY_DN1110_c0_g1_i8:461-826(-)
MTGASPPREKESVLHLFVHTDENPAVTVDSGRTWYSRTANMTGLSEGTRYYYKVGDPVNGYSDTYAVWNRIQSTPKGTSSSVHSTICYHYSFLLIQELVKYKKKKKKKNQKKGGRESSLRA